MWMTSGMMFGASGAIAAALTDESIAFNNPANAAHAGIIFRPDGSLRKIEGDQISDEFVINPGEWHPEEPDASLGALFEVRCSLVTGDAWTSTAAGTGTWIDISAERTWRNFVSAMASPDTQNTTGHFQIRQLGGDGTILAEADISCSASN